MTAFNQSKEDMLTSVQPDQREELEKRIDWAVAKGWTRLGLWPGQDPKTYELLQPDANDLFGQPPNSPYCCFVGSPE